MNTDPPNPPLRILLVEDSPTHTDLIRGALAKGPRPVALTEARGLAEAQRLIASFPPDLAVIDLHLPDGRGSDLLQNCPHPLPCPVVILTGQGSEEAAVETLKAGALDYVVKSPQTLANMGQIIDRAVREWGHVTRRRRAEVALKENERLLGVIFDRAYQYMGLLEPDGTLIKINRTALKAIGAEPDDVLGRPFWETVWWTHSPELQQRLRKAIEKAAGGEFARFESSHPSPRGKHFHLDISIQPVRDEDGRVVLLVPEGRDITERKHAEEAQRLSENRIRAMFDNMAAGVVATNEKGLMIEVNDRWLEMLGRSREEVIGHSPLEFTHPEDREESRKVLDEALSGIRPTFRMEKRYVRSDGSVFWGDLSTTKVFDEQGCLQTSISIVFNISQRRAAEERLKEANRELEAFAYTVSHDLRTPLTPIIGFAEVLQERYRDRLDAEGLGLLKTITAEGRKMMALMEDLLGLAKVGRLERPAEPVDAEEVVREVLTRLGSRIAQAGARIETKSLPAARIPKTLLQQIFENLIGNALRYGVEGGNGIEIGGTRSDGRVRYFVRDHGRGIPEAERDRIFEPFFRGTTGDGQPGTGIGLSIVQKIARLHEGRAWVKETPGGGCTFWVEMAD
ncbi:PAS domain S-box protein [uncultured Desulfuromonas sp.]|uniref:PAS domain S-box protein n=1 Tax=uncultured Desulfuromonas sp. TaxID=181013 RepID=UPI002609DFD8|nr:PAS domain S-box protein [uncultured Desulfuromonas sp.]